MEDDEDLQFELNRDETPKQNSAQATPNAASDSRKNNFLSMEQSAAHPLDSGRREVSIG